MQTIKKLYIQQLSYDGLAYTFGEVAETVSSFNVGCVSFPFKLVGETKDLPTKDYPGESGVKVYVPNVISLKNYDIEVEFVYDGAKGDFKSDMVRFVKFLTGRNDGAVGSRLAIYDDYVKIGRKDCYVTEISPDAYYNDAHNDNVNVTFKVKFAVADPETDVSPIYGTDGATVRTLSF